MGSKPFLSKTCFSITLFNKVVLKTRRLLLAFGKKKPFLSLLILSKVHQKCTCSWQERPWGMFKRKKRQNRMKGTYVPFPSSAPSLLTGSPYQGSRVGLWKAPTCYLLTSWSPNCSSESHSVGFNLGSVNIRDFLCTHWTTSFNTLQEHSASGFKET